ncbi:MAG TPA: polymer-forming cytoskeletal protein [Phycisphaerae bacterium]|nr:polymer-forming cytoskeletal protein [Phycisphaerae bacterium]
MAEQNGEFPTVIGADAKFKGEISFDKGVRIEGAFEGQIKSKGNLHIAEGAQVSANVEAASVTIEGECKGNLTVSEKLHLMATARMEGDMRTNRLEIADGAIFVGNVIVGNSSGGGSSRPAISSQPSARPLGAEASKSGQPPMPSTGARPLPAAQIAAAS